MCVSERGEQSYHDITNQLSGSMTVIRVTTATLGTAIAKVLKGFLVKTSKKPGMGARWRDDPSESRTVPWQRFDVIGDFGAGDEQGLHAKISSWSRYRRVALTCSQASDAHIPHSSRRTSGSILCA